MPLYKQLGMIKMYKQCNQELTHVTKYIIVKVYLITFQGNTVSTDWVTSWY